MLSRFILPIIMQCTSRSSVGRVMHQRYIIMIYSDAQHNRHVSKHKQGCYGLSQQALRCHILFNHKTVCYLVSSFRCFMIVNCTRPLTMFIGDLMKKCFIVYKCNNLVNLMKRKPSCYNFTHTIVNEHTMVIVLFSIDSYNIMVVHQYVDNN